MPVYPIAKDSKLFINGSTFAIEKGELNKEVTSIPIKTIKSGGQMSRVYGFKDATGSFEFPLDLSDCLELTRTITEGVVASLLLWIDGTAGTLWWGANIGIKSMKYSFDADNVYTVSVEWEQVGTPSGSIS